MWDRIIYRLRWRRRAREMLALYVESIPRRRRFVVLRARRIDLAALERERSSSLRG